MAATLPRQIDMTNEVHQLAIDFNDVLAAWTRVGGIADNMRPEPDPHFNRRIKFDRLVLREGGDTQSCHSIDEAHGLLLGTPTGRVNVRGGNGSGKSTLLAALKGEIKNRAYYWPTTDRLAFQFAGKEPDRRAEDDRRRESAEAAASASAGFSSGERQIKSLQEIVAAYRRADLSARRMGRQSRRPTIAPPPTRWCEELAAARARDRDFASRSRRNALEF